LSKKASASAQPLPLAEAPADERQGTAELGIRTTSCRPRPRFASTAVACSTDARGEFEEMLGLPLHHHRGGDAQDQQADISKFNKGRGRCARLRSAATRAGTACSAALA
jgi:hypothetical protein